MENKTKDKLFYWYIVFLRFIAILIGVLVIYWVILKITGHSPTFELVVSVIGGVISIALTALIAFMVKLYGEMGEVKVELKYMKKGINHGFRAVKEDIGYLKSDVTCLKSDVSSLKSDVSSLRADMTFIKAKLQ